MASRISRLQRVVDERREEVFSLRARVQEWVRERDAVAAELDEVSRATLESAFDAGIEAATASSAKLAELQDKLRVAERAIEDGTGRVIAAERAFLAAEAERVEAADMPPVAAALEAHQAETDRLVAQLAEHEGEFVPARLGHKRSHELRSRVTRLELQIRALRAMAEGVRVVDALRSEWSVVDGRYRGFALEELLPACVQGPDAVVPAIERDVAAAEAFDHAHRLEVLRSRERDLLDHAAPQERRMRQVQDEIRVLVDGDPSLIEAAARRASQQDLALTGF